MDRIYTELESFSQWPAGDRIAALKSLRPPSVLAEVATEPSFRSRFCRRLPNWFVLGFVVGIGLFSWESDRQVFQWLSPFRQGRTPGRSTLCMARHRLGVGPVRRLLARAVTLLATPSTPGAFHRPYRRMGVDGFVLDPADSVANDRVFGRPTSGRGVGAYPQARVLSRCELGTHVLCRTRIKPLRRGECSIAPALCRHLRPDMLLLWDRNVFSYRLIRQVVLDRRAQLLARVQTRLVFRPTAGCRTGRTWPGCTPRTSTGTGIGRGSTSG